MTNRWIAVALMLSLTLVAAPASAHHSMSAEFDLTRHVTVTGVITKLDWTNPHIRIYLDNQVPGKNDVGWGIEGAPPHGLSRRGITAAAIPVGTRITVEGFPTTKSNLRKISGITVTLPDGKKIDIRDSMNWTTLPR